MVLFLSILGDGPDQVAPDGDRVLRPLQDRVYLTIFFRDRTVCTVEYIIFASEFLMCPIRACLPN